MRPAGTGKGCIVWELLDAHPEMRVLWVVSCAARLELRRALTKRLGRTLDGRVRLMSCEQLAVQNALGWVALAEFRPGLLVLDGWREMSAKDWTDCVQPLFRLCPGAKLLALGEPDAPGDSCRAAEEMLADAIVEPLALGGAMAEGLLPMPASYTALLWPLEDAMARLRAEVKNLHLPGCPDPNAEKYQALSLAVEKLPPVEQLLAQWLPDGSLSSARMMQRRRRPQSRPRSCLVQERIFIRRQKALRPTKRPPSGCWSVPTARRCSPLWPGSRAWCWCAAALDRPHTGRCWHAPLQPAAVCRWQS